jgi:hypothetical protein
MLGDGRCGGRGEIEKSFKAHFIPLSYFVRL